MMNLPFISIIVPIYNVEKYLRKCLDSILAQTLTDYEAILVDDGSTDQSRAICDEYAAKDSRFVVVHKQNGGVSSARNTALKIAKGEWIYFVDADDEILPNGLALFYNNVTDELDLISASYIRYEQGIVIPETNECVNIIYSREQFIRAITYFKTRNSERYCWNKLFRSSVIRNNNLAFDHSLAYREDIVFLYSYLICCNKSVLCIKEPVYVYYRRLDGAAMTLLDQYTPKSKGIFLAIEKCLILVHEHNISPESERKLKKELESAYLHMRKVIKKTDKSELKSEQRELWNRLANNLTTKEMIIFIAKDLVRPIYRIINKSKYEKK